MRIDYKDLIRSIEDVAINKTARDLMAKGYKAIFDYRLGNVSIDLYAEKDDERIIYEFKLANRPLNRETYEHLQNVAKSINAKLKIVYVSRPKFDKAIEFDGLEDLIFNSLVHNTPKDLKELPSFVMVNEVNDVSIDYIRISDGYFEIKGDCLINPKLAHICLTSSFNDKENNCCIDSGMSFYLKLDKDHKIIERKFTFDLDSL